MGQKTVHDPVYGSIHLDDLEWSLIGSKPVQRLRGIRQLALVDSVYPGATHTRFEHSVGTMHMAGRIAANLGLCDADVRKVRIAGLLHDLGHSAFSHAVEGLLSRNPDLQPLMDGAPASRHEHFTGSIILGHQFGEEALGLVEEEFGSAKVFFREIGEIALGRRPPLGEILSGDLDADRIDFLLRDSHHTGVSLGLVDVDQIFQALTLKGGHIVLSGEDDYRSDLSQTAAESMLIARAHHYNALVHHPRVQSARAMLLYALENVLSGFDPDEVSGEVLKFFVEYDDAGLLEFMEREGSHEGRRILERITQGQEYPLVTRFDHRTMPPGVRMALSTISRNGRMCKLFETGMQKRYPALLDISVGSGVPRSVRTSEGFLYDESALASGLIKSLSRQLTLSFFSDESVDVPMAEVEALASRLLNFMRVESYLPIEGLLLLFYSLHSMLSQTYGERVLVPRLRNITWVYGTVGRLKEMGKDEPGLEGLYDYHFHKDYGFPYSEGLFGDIQVLVAMGMVYQDLRHYVDKGRWKQRYEYMLTSEGLAYAEDVAEAYSREREIVKRYLQMEKHTIPYDKVSLLMKRYRG